MLECPKLLCLFPAFVELAPLVPLVHRVVVIHPAGGSGEKCSLAEVGSRAAEHMRVPRKINVVRWHEEVVLVAVLLHEAEELQVPRTRCGSLAASQLRDLPEEGTLACRAGLCIVVEAERATHPNTRLLYLRAERCLLRERVTRAPIRRTIATPLEERFVTKVLLPQTPGLVAGDRGSLRRECRRSRIQDPPKALRAVCGVSLLPLLSKIPKMKMAQTDSGSSLPQRYRCCSFVKVQTSL